MRTSTPLDATTATDAAVRDMLRQQLATVRANTPSLGSLTDTRPLHDLRVAVRRSRVALRLLRKALPDNTYTQLRDGLKWLARSTNASRDLDVQFTALAAYIAQLPAADKKALKPLLTALSVDRRDQHRQLQALIKSERYTQLLADWQASLAAAPQANPLAERPIQQTAKRQIKKHYHRVRKNANALHKHSNPYILHELRIAAKKLRYVLEFFRPLYPPKLIENCIRDLKALQDELGDLHDLSLLLAMLHRYRQQLDAERSGSASARAALDDLIATCVARQAQTQKNARHELGRITQARSRAAYKRLWHNPAEA